MSGTDDRQQDGTPLGGDRTPPNLTPPQADTPPAGHHASPSQPQQAYPPAQGYPPHQNAAAPGYPPHQGYSPQQGGIPHQAYGMQQGQATQQGYAPYPGHAPQPGYAPPPGYQPQSGYAPQYAYPPQAYPARKSRSWIWIALAALIAVQIAGAAILYFTGAFDGERSGSSVPSRYGSSASSATSGAGNSALAARLEQAVAAFRPRLPLANGPATISDVTAEGTRMTMVMTISQDVSALEWSQIEASIRRNVCAGPFGAAIRQGASATVMMSDAAGESREVTVTSC